MLSQDALHELNNMCRKDDKALGRVFTLLESGLTSNQEIVDAGGGGNAGAVGINRQILDAILLGKIPKSSNISTYAYRAINRLNSANDPISAELAIYLKDLVTDLKSTALDEKAIRQSVLEAEKESKSLEKLLTTVTNAVYVYSYPTYLRVGTADDPELYWFKIGYTGSEVGSRILAQVRQTAMPEDPVIVRVYHKPGYASSEIESKFHQTLDAFRQQRSSSNSKKAGKEWFATDLERLDAIAKLLEMVVEY